MGARGRRGNRGPRSRYVTTEMFEELQEQFRNLTQLFTQAMNSKSEK